MEQQFLSHDSGYLLPSPEAVVFRVLQAPGDPTTFPVPPGDLLSDEWRQLILSLGTNEAAVVGGEDAMRN